MTKIKRILHNAVNVTVDENGRTQEWPLPVTITLIVITAGFYAYFLAKLLF